MVHDPIFGKNIGVTKKMRNLIFLEPPFKEKSFKAGMVWLDWLDLKLIELTAKRHSIDWLDWLKSIRIYSDLKKW